MIKTLERSFLLSLSIDFDFLLILAPDFGAVFKNLSQIPHAYTYQREYIPGRYHYQRHLHIGDLIITLEPGYELHQRSSRK
jgi:hypothetical protein